MRSISLVGLDVHAAQTHAAILDVSTGELRGAKLQMAPVDVVDFLAGLPGPVQAVYEAGPTGFGLAREARLRGDLMRARHRLGKMLLRRDIRWNGPGSAWTVKHMSWLRSLRFDDPCSTAVFIDYLSGIEMLIGRRAALLAALEQAIPDSRHADTIARLRCFRGIDTLSAAGLCAEIGDWQRFRPKQLSGFLGIVPSEYTSDTERRQGSITKSGPVHARRLLVEAAHTTATSPPSVTVSRDRGLLARATPTTSALDRAARPASQARRRRHDRGRPRARGVLLGGRHPRLIFI